jgi:hypothetical protein
MTRLHEVRFFMCEPTPLVVTSAVSGPRLTDPVLRARAMFATDVDYRAYLEHEREAATIRGDTDLAAAAAKALATP